MFKELSLHLPGLYRVMPDDRVQWLQVGGQGQTVSTCKHTSSGGWQDQEEMGTSAYTEVLGPHKAQCSLQDPLHISQLPNPLPLAL